MKRIWIGLLALVVLAGAGYFGATTYSRMRAASEVDAVFTQLRTNGREATHGEVGFDLFKRTLTVADISLRETDGTTLRIARLTADRLAQPQEHRLAVRTLTLDGIAVTIPEAGARGRADYTVPRVVAEDYEGPDALLPRREGPQPVLNLALRQLAATRAQKITVPELSARIAAVGPGGVSTAIGYRNLSVTGVAEGKIAEITFDDLGFTTTAPQDQPALAAKGSLKRFAAAGIDTGPLRALTEPNAAPGLAPIYQRITATGYTVTQGDGSQVEVAEAQLNGLAIDPSRPLLDRMQELTTLGERTPPLPEADSRRLMAVTADIVEGIGFTDFSMRDIGVIDTNGKVRIATIRLSALKAGRLDRLSLEGVGADIEGEPAVKLGAFVLKGLSLPPLLAYAAQNGSGRADRIGSELALLKSLEGIEISSLSRAPAEGDGGYDLKLMTLDWGQFVGLVPTRIALKIDGLAGPISEADGAPLSYLAATGLKTATVGLETGLTYDPATRIVRLAPGTTRVDQAFVSDVSLSLTDVRSEAFEDPIAALAAAQRIGIGPATMTFTDQGIIALMLKARAESANTTPEAERADMIATIRSAAKDLTPLYPEASAIGETLAGFFEKPGTLRIVLTPLGDLKLMDVIAADPVALLQNFKVEVTAGP